MDEGVVAVKIVRICIEAGISLACQPMDHLHKELRDSDGITSPSWPWRLHPTRVPFGQPSYILLVSVYPRNWIIRMCLNEISSKFNRGKYSVMHFLIIMIQNREMICHHCYCRFRIGSWKNPRESNGSEIQCNTSTSFTNDAVNLLNDK
jgi:hypothetical protein